MNTSLEGRLSQGREAVRLPGPYIDPFILATPESLRVERHLAIEAGRRLARSDRALFASLGHVFDVSIAPLGTRPQKGFYNVRIPTEQTNPKVIEATGTVLIGCADRRLAGLQQQIADFAYNGDTSKVLPVLLAGGVVQPHTEELVSGLDTSFTSTSREDDLRTVVNYIVRTQQKANPDKPLRVIFSGHDGGCAFVTKMFRGPIEQHASQDAVREAGADTEAALMNRLITTHGNLYHLPSTVEASFYRFTPRGEDEHARIAILPQLHPFLPGRRLADSLEAPLTQ
jgi:hypothetical protein